MDSLVAKYGKPILDSGPQRMSNGLIRGIRWTKAGVLTPPAAGLVRRDCQQPRPTAGRNPHPQRPHGG